MSKNELLDVLKSVCGLKPELTIRGDKKFTFSFDDVQIDACEKITKYFQTAKLKINVIHDDECGSFIYLDA